VRSDFKLLRIVHINKLISFLYIINRRLRRDTFECKLLIYRRVLIAAAPLVIEKSISQLSGTWSTASQWMAPLHVWHKLTVARFRIIRPASFMSASAEALLGRRSKCVRRLLCRYCRATFIDVRARHGPPAISHMSVLGPHTHTHTAARLDNGTVTWRINYVIHTAPEDYIGYCVTWVQPGGLTNEWTASGRRWQWKLPAHFSI